MTRVRSFFKKGKIKRVMIPALAITLALGILLFVLMKKTVTIVINGDRIKVTTFSSKVEGVLKDNDIILGLKDKINTPIDSKLKENDVIVIDKAVKVMVTADGAKREIESAEDNIDKMLAAEGISLGAEDKIEPGLLTELSQGLNIVITRVETKTLTENVKIGYKEVVKTDKNMANTKINVVREGKDGEKKVTYSVVYEDGKEVKREVVEETIIKKAVDRLVVKGGYPYMPVSRGGRVMPYSRVFKARATAYWAVNGVGTTYTASGRRAVWNPDGYSTIAVDPKLIPYGTRLFVEGYGFAIAADTGTAIKGEKIDVYFNTKQQARDWAVKYVKVYILN